VEVTAQRTMQDYARVVRWLVDTDAQSHATFWFVDDPSEIHYDLQDIDKHEVPIAKVIRPIGINGLDLLPATLALAPFELELATFP
jgi:cellulose biosynthesis protein BcsQ